jgi:tRNA-binding protein
MNYSLFYNYKLIGDILMVVFDNETIPTSKEVDGDVVKIYSGDKLIGVNIFNFSEVVKIKSHGLIPLPHNQLIDVINNIFKNHNLETLPYKTESGFKIGKILTVDEHPESTHLHILKVDVGTEVLDIVCGAANVAENAIVVVATIGTTMFDGTVIKPGKLLGEVSNGMCCSERELNLTEDQTKRGLLLLDESYEIGSDFFNISAN